MALTISITDEVGNEISSISDERNILHRILPSHDDQAFFCLNKIDWYGDTIFNRYQIADLIAEFRRLEKQTIINDDLALINNIIELALESKSTPHLYLKFIGD